MRLRLRIVLTCILLMLSSIYAVPEGPKPATTRPSVGLVLEGGGALGLAHVGVLQWLEEHRIPVNYVAGTSMGGLVGGLYATGHSAAEVQDLVKEIHWDAVLKGQIPYQDLSFRRKQDASEYPNKLEFGLRNGLEFPEGYNSGQEVDAILDRVALPYSEVQNFNDLPIPFGCVSTDLVTSKKYVFRSGSLSLAMRSTMSLPGIFTPVRWNGHIFADGGLLDNLPVDVAKEMGADITLAIHLQTAPLESDTNMSSFGVLGRSISVVVASNELRSMEKADILVSVPLAGYNSMEYNRAEALIKAGYDAAQGKAAILASLSVDEATWQQYLADRSARRKSVPVPQFVAVIGTGPMLSKAIEAGLQNNVGKPVDTTSLETQLLDLQGEGRFSNLSYQMTSKQGQPGLQITAVEKPYSPPIVRPLILLDGSNFNNVFFSLGARITFLDFGSYRAELRNDVIIGSEYGIRSQYYRPFSASSNWFIAPNAFADSQHYPIYQENNLIAEYRKTFSGGGIDVGYEFGRVAQLSLGYTAAYEKLTPDVGDPNALPNVSGRYGATTLRFALNELDNPVIPRAGQFINFVNQWIDANPGALHSYPLSEARYLKFVPVKEASSVYFSAVGGTTYGNQFTGVPAFSLGGGNNFAAYGQNELLTNQYYLFQAGFLRPVAKLPVLLGDRLYVNALFEVGKTFSPPFKSQVPGDFSASLVVNTIFGPVSIGGAVGATGHQRVFFKLGRIF